MQSASKNIFWLSFSRAAALVLLFFAYRALFRYLGPFTSGQYQFILSYVMLFATVVDFGIQQFITKKISEEPEKSREYFHNFFAFETAVALVLYALLLGIAQFKHYDRAVFYGICVAGAGMVANALTYPYLAVMTAFQDLRRVAWINFLNSLVNVGVIFAAVIFHRSVVFLASVQVAFGILDLMLYRIFILRHLPKPGVLAGLRKFDLSIVFKILRQGWPFALLVGFSAIYNRIDVVIIALLRGYEQTGLYTAAYKIFDLLGFFPSVVSYTLFPVFSRLMSQSALSEVRQNLEKYLRLMVMAALPMAVGGTLLSRQLILLMTNNDIRFLPAAPVLSILIWAPAILFIYIPVNSLVISQLTRKAVIITGANVIVNIVGNLLLIPHYGIKAAAAMTVVSESLQGGFYFYFVRRTITAFSFWNVFYKPLIASLIMGAALHLAGALNVFVRIVLGGAVYVLLLIIFRHLSKKDLQFFRGLIFKSA